VYTYINTHKYALSLSLFPPLSLLPSLSLSFSLFLSHTHTHIHKHIYQHTHVLHPCLYPFYVHVYMGLLYKRINAQSPSNFASPLNVTHTRQNLSCFICMQRDSCMCHIPHSQNKTSSHFTRQKSLSSHISQGKSPLHVRTQYSFMCHISRVKTSSVETFHKTRLLHFTHFSRQNHWNRTNLPHPSPLMRHISQDKTSSFETFHTPRLLHFTHFSRQNSFTFHKAKLLHITQGRIPSHFTRQHSFISHQAKLLHISRGKTSSFQTFHNTRLLQFAGQDFFISHISRDTTPSHFTRQHFFISHISQCKTPAYEFKCATWLLHMCDMAHSYVWHNSSIFTWKAVFKKLPSILPYILNSGKLMIWQGVFSQ